MPAIKLAKEDDGFSRLIENYLRELFDERNVSDLQRKKLWKFYYDELSQGVANGYNPSLENYDPALANSLKYNISEFSAFKETSFRKQLEGMLTKNGKIIPWSKFKEKALAVSGDYNKRWLKSEYHHTVATANMAGKFKDFEANQDLYPNLKYVTVGDKRVRQKHENWDGLILPINHPWWKKHLPPNDWGCRCGVEPSDEEKSNVIPEGDVKSGFANNPAQTGEVFKDITYKEGLSDLEQDNATAMANKMFREEPATRAYIKSQRKEIKLWGRENLIGSTIKHKSLENPIGFNVSGLKEFANQPYKFEVEKLKILKNIQSVVKDSKYLGSRSIQDNVMLRRSHILEIDVKEEKSWLVLRELKNGEVFLYSISDGVKITKGLK